jgi:hypothetical protein
VSSLGDVLELLHNADDRWRGVRAAVRDWRDQPLVNEAFEAEFEGLEGTLLTAVGTHEVPDRIEIHLRRGAE